MNLCRCENGHFYDKEKFSTCPHCAGGVASDESLTSVFTDDVTEPVTPEVGATIPDSSAASMEAFAPNQAFPVADIPAEQNTVDYVDPDAVTIPLDVTEKLNNDDDDDHTVGFFDDEFFGAPSTPAPVAPTPVVKAAPAVNKASTPCVGWLVALNGAHIGTDFRLKVGKNFIGRDPHMDIALVGDKSVSRDRQAIVVYEPKEHMYLIQPGEASTLVYKNNEVVLSPVKLAAYDVITVGDVNLVFMPLCNKNFNWSDLLEEMKRR